MPAKKTPAKLPIKDLQVVLTNPWDNIYWFARMLIASDKYGGIGTDSKTMLSLTALIKEALKKLPADDEATTILMNSVRNLLVKRWSNTKKEGVVANLCDDLAEKLLTPKDFEVLALTCEKVLVPINEAMNHIPNNDRAFAESIAKALLSTKGEAGLSTVINLWDDIGSQGCITAERIEIVRLFADLRKYLNNLVSEEERDITLSAFCQEFERRVGQKRKGRAGRGVESVTGFILDHFGIRASKGPEHFTTGLEIDRWVRGKDGWYIGLSCKRTLRERWKQVHTTDVGLLDRHKIKSLWHVSTYDRDLSDDKVTEMGSNHRAIFYLPDDSPRYRVAIEHPGLKRYVRPLSMFVSDLKKETGG